MRRACSIVAAFIFASAAQGQGSPRSEGIEIGARYWLSSGSTTRSIDATSLDPSAIHPLATGVLNPSATTNYEQLDANILELFGRKRIEDRFFVKGTAGVGKINHGTLIDETFFLIGSDAFHTMALSATDGKLGYATLDVGTEVVRGRETTFGLFVGYHYWQEKVQGHGYSDAFGPLGLPPDVLVVTNETIWHAVRLGGELRVTRGRTRFVMEATWIPYAGYTNEATHHLNPDSSPRASGNGRGGTFDAELRRSFPQLGGVELGIGVRYWKLNAYNGNEVSGGVSFPIVDLASERRGFTFTAAKNW